MITNLFVPCMVQGIVNVTPDSFSDGVETLSVVDKINHGLHLIAQGAHMLDVGGESTRPGYTPISADEELRRILPVIEGLHAHSVYISVDTHKPCVMKAVLAAGVQMINDVNAFHGEDGTGSAVAVVSDSDCRIVVMDGFSAHSQAQKQAGIHLIDRLSTRYEALLKAGIAASRIVIDPGIGFNKTLEENLDCIRCLPQLKQIAPVLIGGSRKSMLGVITGKSVDMRMPASIALALLAAQRGASIVRVHDVAATVDALNVYQAL
jgi:dihydropteroate synthase